MAGSVSPDLIAGHRVALLTSNNNKIKYLSCILLHNLKSSMHKPSLLRRLEKDGAETLESENPPLGPIS